MSRLTNKSCLRILSLDKAAGISSMLRLAFSASAQCSSHQGEAYTHVHAQNASLTINSLRASALRQSKSGIMQCYARNECNDLQETNAMTN